jgi:site-specific DNA-methyltransferase (adenine-specific)
VCWDVYAGAAMSDYQIHLGDCIDSMRQMPDQSVHCCVTSPPYFGLRDYGHDGQIGLEPTPEEFVAKLVEVFREVRRVLRDDGTLWLNLGDSYASYRDGKATPDTTRGKSLGTFVEKGKAKNRSASTFVGTSIKHKDLIGIPWRVAFALQSDGWYLRQDIIWHKPNPMPESVTDRCTKSHEYIFLLSKSAKYYYDNEAIKEDAQNWGTRDRSAGKYTSGDVPISGGAHKGLQGKDDEENPTRNKRSVWTVTTKPYAGAHFATFPPDLIEPCILAGCPENGTVIDPFGGSGTTAGVALASGRNAILCELNPAYKPLIVRRVADLRAKNIEMAI